jgi:ATP/maltotriose-dependent transcriptional regulator MalT
MGSRPHSDARARSRPWQRTRQRGADLPVISSTSPLIERDRELSLFEDILGADAGAGSRAVVIEGPASERRVAALAADGRSNKEIAQSLYVTPKTVEVHLSNAYRKLSIRSRLQLAVALSA